MHNKVLQLQQISYLQDIIKITRKLNEWEIKLLGPIFNKNTVCNTHKCVLQKQKSQLIRNAESVKCASVVFYVNFCGCFFIFTSSF